MSIVDECSELKFVYRLKDRQRDDSQGRGGINRLRDDSQCRGGRNRQFIKDGCQLQTGKF